MSFPADSFAMRLARRLGWERGAWAMRRIHCPVPKDALVLEIGSGGNPYPRANILLDAHERTRQRHWAPLVADRPTLLGLAERLPFRDKSFDFIIASHVLEHSADPDRFLAELQRVGKAGYIESPDAFMERVNPYRDHRLEVTERQGRLIIRKKAGWQADPELVALYEQHAKKWIARQAIPAHPTDFHVRHYWTGSIDFEVVNPSTDSSWEPPDDGPAPADPGATTLRAHARRWARAWLSQTARNKALDLIPLLRCPSCLGTALQRGGGSLSCANCGTGYPVRDGIPDMRNPQARNRHVA